LHSATGVFAAKTNELSVAELNLNQQRSTHEGNKRDVSAQVWSRHRIEAIGETVVSSRTMNPAMMIKNQPKALDREKHGRNRNNTGSIQDHMMIGASRFKVPIISYMI
jgi:hypothetical protein